MSKDDKSNRKGFAGLDDMVSDLDAPILTKKPQPPPDATTSTPVKEGRLPPTPPPNWVFYDNNQTPPPIAKRPPNKKMFGVAAVVLIAVVIAFNASQKKSNPVAASGAPQVSKPTTRPELYATASAPPLAPAPGPKYFYKLRASDGVVIEVEGPPKASDVQLHEIALRHWMPKETYPLVQGEG